MFWTLLVCLLVVAVINNIISIIMKIRVNASRSDDQKLSWWSRDFREVNRAYQEYDPDSVMPDLDKYGTYVLFAFLAAILLVSITSK